MDKEEEGQLEGEGDQNHSRFDAEEGAWAKGAGDVGCTQGHLESELGAGDVWIGHRTEQPRWSFWLQDGRTRKRGSLGQRLSLVCE